MNPRRVRFSGGLGFELAGVFDLPEEGSPRGLALFAHCFTCGKDLKSLVWIGRTLAAQGIASLRFDFTGLGESGGDFATTSFSSNVTDLVAAAAFLAERHAGAPLLLVGHSLGGTAALRAAGRIPSCRGVVTVAAPSTPRGLAHLFDGKEEELARTGGAEVSVGGRLYRLNREFLDDISAHAMEEAIASLTVPLLVLHAPDDATVRIDHAMRIFATAPHPKSFISLDKADHILRDEGDARWAGELIAAWGKRYLEHH